MGFPTNKLKARMYLRNLRKPILAMPRLAKSLVVSTVDTSLCVLTVWIAYYLRLGDLISLSGNALFATGMSIAIALPVFFVSGLYRAIFRYSGWPALLTVARAVGVYGLIYASIFTAIGVDGVPRTVGLINPILLLLFVGASRALARVWLSDEYRSNLSNIDRPRALIYGAGHAGRQLAAAMNGSQGMQVVGFLDDDARLHGHVLNGLTIYSPKELSEVVTIHQVSDVLLAMPNISRKHRNDILSQIRSAQVAVRTLPSVTDLAQGKVSVSDLRDLDIDDLLGRDPIAPNQLLLAQNIIDKIVLVTGAGGSIGSELCRQILSVGPSKLLLIEHSEFALYSIHQELELRLTGSSTILVPLLASVQDEDRLKEIITTWRPATIYHAAAYKHVPLVEHNPAEGIKNNVLGTLYTARAAIENEVSDFVLISTDKAVRPTNIMGASKRLAEMTLQALTADREVFRKASKEGLKTRFSMVRFGNVLGSSGSVVPKFRQQIRDGGPITLTHSDITRYFMTISEAAQLVIQAGAMAKGGEVFVLDMGEAVKIIDLARRMVELSGLQLKDSENPDGDIEIEITGLRPGEKLYEELLIGNNPSGTSHHRIMKAQEDYLPWAELKIRLSGLEQALCNSDITAIRSMMMQLVPGYTPSEKIVDWVYLEHESEAPTGDASDWYIK